MIEIDKATIDAVRGADSPAHLHRFLRDALRLEHATVPLYLTAYFSLERDSNRDVGAALRSIVREEMLHFAIVANLINAVGGHPRIDSERTVPVFPGPLPMGVAENLSVSLAPMSKAQCQVFMTIEEPDDPIAEKAGRDTRTIGDFYAAIVEKLTELGDQVFRRPSAPQVVSPWFPSDQLFAITDVASATRALALIVEQGEGTTASPDAGAGSHERAHYYRFAEIVHGARLVADPAAPEGFSYTGEPVDFAPEKVHPLVEKPSIARYADDPASLRLATEFCAVYRRLLIRLDETFTGAPGTLDRAMGLMFELRLAALAMVETPDPADPGVRLTPSWEYLARLPVTTPG